MLKAFDVPLPWPVIARRTAREVVADNCPGLAAELAYFFLLALFPALLCIVALISFIPVDGVLDAMTALLARVVPSEALTLIQDQLLKIANDKNAGLLTFGVLGAVWSTSAGVTAIIGTLNRAYDIEEGRSWWHVRLLSLGLTIALAAFMVAATALVLVGPALIERVAAIANLDRAFASAWAILRWPVALSLVAGGIGLIYYYAPDAEQEWIWITPGCVLATVLWLIASAAFKFYVSNFGSYNATYGAIGGVIILMLWLYVSALAVLIGAELNAEIEHASPWGKAPGEKKPGEKRKLGALARRLYEERERAGMLTPKALPASPAIGALPAWSASASPRPRASDWILSGLVLGPASLLVYAKLRSRFNRLKT